MSVSTQALLWCVIQISVICVVAGVIARLTSKRNPALGVWCLRTALMLSLGLTIAAPFPLPCWFSKPVRESEPQAVAASTPGPEEAATNASEHVTELTTSDTAEPNVMFEELKRAFQASVTLPPVTEPIATTDEATEPGKSLPLPLICVLAGLSLGTIWFLVGTISVRQLVRQSTPLSEPRATETLDVVLAELSCTRNIRLVEANVASAATVGFLRPVVLIPRTWRDWSDEELHAVLAHEVAHVRANDFGATVFGQFIVAIHFFHPVVHWLTRQLRITQELAADAAASDLAGGRTSYATVLASMALRENRQSNLWATQAFLPAPRTLLRRIEMLRDATRLQSQTSRPARLTIGVAMLAVTCAAAGLRANPSEPPTSGPAAPTASVPATPIEPKPLSLAWVPNGSLFVVAIKPAELLKHEAMAKSAPALTKLAETFGYKASELDSVTIAATLPNTPSGNVMIVRSSRTDWKSVTSQFKNMAETKITDDKASNLTVYANRNTAYFMPDKQTLITGRPGAVNRVARSGGNGTTNRFWIERWKTLRDKPAAILFDIGALRESAKMHVRESSDDGTSHADEYRAVGMHGINELIGQELFNATRGIWEKGELFAMSASLEDNIELDGTITTADETHAVDAHKGAKAGLDMMRKMMRSAQYAVARSSSPHAAVQTSLLAAAETALAKTKSGVDGEDVSLSASLRTKDVSKLLTQAVPVLTTSSVAAGQVQTMNNLKNIALALHNYYDVHGSFPPSQSMGKDGNGDHAVSWRVLITPYLERNDIYQSYKFDEPWDSPANKKATARMPAMFAHPQSPANSSNTAYFGIVSRESGTSTGFGRRTGMKFDDFRDGTANSLLVVESKQDIHWAKPEDIVWTKANPIPKLGGFAVGSFFGARADGSVSRFSLTADPKELIKMINISDGEVPDQGRLMVR